MTDIPLIYDDQRAIAAIWYDGEGAGGYSIDPCHDKSTSKIAAYREHGLSDFTPYFAVYDHQGSIKARVPAYMVTVIYQEVPAND